MANICPIMVKDEGSKEKVGGVKKNLIDYPMIIIGFYLHMVPRTDIWWTCPPSATRGLVFVRYKKMGWMDLVETPP